MWVEYQADDEEIKEILLGEENERKDFWRCLDLANDGIPMIYTVVK